MTVEQERHSQPCVQPAFINLTKEQRAPIEAQNALRQFDRLIEILLKYLDERNREETYHFYLKPSHAIELNRIAVDRLVDNPGAYRQVEMAISKSSHKPPDWKDVPKHLDDMCDYVNRNWHRSAVHLSAYVMWRLNWIHPFMDGNGRTARAISYLVLSAKLRQRLPGERTIPDFITDDKKTLLRRSGKSRYEMDQEDSRSFGHGKLPARSS